jgi:hypothetical protein
VRAIAIVVLGLVACVQNPDPLQQVVAEHNARALADNARERQRVQDILRDTERRAAETKAREADRRAERQPPAIGNASPDETPADRCARTRADRVREAKRALTITRDHLAEVEPMLKFATAHKCELKDTRGSVLVTKTKEAAGTRYTAKEGRYRDVVCDTAQLPPDLTADMLEEVIRVSYLKPDDLLYASIEECDAIESPSLRVTYGEPDHIRAIMKIPDAP